MRDTLICTVGTSLKGNIDQQLPSSRLRKLWDSRNNKGLSVELNRISPTDRICGAEINSIHSIIEKGLLQQRAALIFFVSDTDDGRFIGEILKKYYESSRNPHRFERVEVRVIEGLTDRDIIRFRNQGLKNLVKRISEVVKTPEESKRILINATGGYKAQISFAGMIGQALDIPVCYMYEGFSEVIQLPPQPVVLDLSFWLGHNDLFYDLEEGIEQPASACSEDERFESLIESELIDGRHLTSFSHTGQLFQATFRHHFGRQRLSLLPGPSLHEIGKKPIRYEDKNAEKHRGLKLYLEKVKNILYVNEIYTHYYNPDLAESKRFRKSSKGIIGYLEGIFSNDGAVSKFTVVTTAGTIGETQACIADLNELLSRGDL